MSAARCVRFRFADASAVMSVRSDTPAATAAVRRDRRQHGVKNPTAAAGLAVAVVAILIIMPAVFLAQIQVK